LKDVYILDTDPCPDFAASYSSASAENKLFSGLSEMVNKQDFSDITFMVQDKPFYGHKIIISQLSDKL